MRLPRGPRSLSLVFMSMTLAAFTAHGLGAGLLRKRVLARPRALGWLWRILAGSLVALALRLALAEW